jgi:Trk K+ transport system NAD-binding subunit
VVRDLRLVTAGDETELRPGDEVLVLAQPHDRDQLQQVFTTPAAP